MFAALILPYWFCNGKTKKAQLIFGTCLIFLLVIKGGYAMQPPPPPLNLAQLRMLTSEADIIAVGEIDSVKETKDVKRGKAKKSVEAILSVEKLLKGKVVGKAVVIRESYKTFDPQLTDFGSKDKGAPKKMIVSSRAGPSSYHGRYRQGMRMVVLLERIERTNEYRPLGSGTYDKHLCEFPIENDGIKTFYFRFAADLGQYVGSEENFIGLIRSLIDSNPEKRKNNG